MNCIITESEYRRLLLDSERLRRLEEGGVDNWTYYYYVLNPDNDLSIDELEEQYVDDIIKSHKHITN